MRLSCSIMAHPVRVGMVDVLTEQLGPVAVAWDRHGDEWDTAARAWQAHDPDADWHLVVQDDAVVCRDLLPAVARALDHVPAESVVSLYLGDTRPAADRIRGIAAAADAAEASWVRMPSLIWGVAIAVPVATIRPMLDWCHRHRHPNYDARVARFYAEVLQWPALFSWPSLVDHRDATSLLEHPGVRRAHRFVGGDTSALDWDWSGPALTAPAARRQRIQRRTRVETDLLVASKTTVIHHEGKRTVIRKGVHVAEVGADIVRGREDMWTPLVVHFPADPSRSYHGVTARPPAPDPEPAAREEPPRRAEPDRKAVRSWAAAQGIDVPSRGRVPAEVVELYLAAHSGQSTEA